MATTEPIKDALETFMYKLAESPPSELGEGSHIIHVPLKEVDPDGTLLACPKVGQEVRVILRPSSPLDTATTINRKPGILNVKVKAAQAGSNSEHSTSAYAELFQNPKWQRPEYAEFQKKKELRREKEREEAQRRREEREAEL